MILINLLRFSIWTKSRLFCDIYFRGRYLPSIIKFILFQGGDNKVVPTAFDISKWYTLWESVCTDSENPYFYLYIYYVNLDPIYGTEVNIIGRILKYIVIVVIIP